MHEPLSDRGRRWKMRVGRSEGAFVTSFTRSEELAVATAQLSEIAHVGRERRETLQCKSSCHDLDCSPCRSWLVVADDGGGTVAVAKNLSGTGRVCHITGPLPLPLLLVQISIRDFLTASDAASLLFFCAGLLRKVLRRG